MSDNFASRYTDPASRKARIEELNREAEDLIALPAGDEAQENRICERLDAIGKEQRTLEALEHLQQQDK